MTGAEITSLSSTIAKWPADIFARYLSEAPGAKRTHLSSLVRIQSDTFCNMPDIS
jgi:hypothetical protein